MLVGRNSSKRPVAKWLLRPSYALYKVAEDREFDSRQVYRLF